ncbi:MAG TPA: PAS domain S-box protein [Verrucomicrobiae bacterium]
MNELPSPMGITHTTPPSRFRILILDSNPGDVAVFLARLTQEGWNVDHAATSDRDEFKRLVEREQFDVILSEFTIGNWTALDAIQILQEQQVDTPLILVTGTMGDELAVECIHQGASDFILKDSLARLPLAIQRACKENRLLREKQNIDEALRLSEENLRLLIDGVKDYAIYSLDSQGRIVSWNAGAERITGYQEADILGHAADIFYPEWEKDRFTSMAAKARSEGRAEMEGWRIRKDGSRFWAHVIMAPVTDGNGLLKGFSKVMRDITERHRIEAELRCNVERSYEQQSALSELIRSDAIKGDDLGAAVRRVCEISARTLGVVRVSFWRYNIERDAIVCLELYELSTGTHSSGTQLKLSDSPQYFNAIGNSMLICAEDVATSPHTAGLYEHYLKPFGISSMMDVPVYLNGRMEGVLCHEHIGPIREWQSDERTFALAVANVVSLVLDQHERRLTELALKESEHRFQQLVNVVQQVFWLKNSDGSQIIYISPAYESVFGRPRIELIRNAALWVETIHPDDRPRIRRAVGMLSQGVEYNLEFRMVRPDGQIRWIRDRGFPVKNELGQIVRSAGVAEDITQHKQLEAQFLQAQKMESIGRLAGGVAHDFNNMLTAIRSFALLARDSVDPESMTHKDLEQVLEATTRAEGVTRRLLAFARQQVFRPEVIEPNSLLKNLQKMLGRLIREDVVLELHPGEHVGSIKADPSQMEQMIINLALNSVDAMPRGGLLSISSAPVSLEAEEARKLDLQPGRYVRLQVTDNGMGMSDEVKAHLFEPFFTTKPTGSGTGLGLATVYGIVHQTGGAISVESELGKGTTFAILLPETTETAEVKLETTSDSQSLRGKETILVVEDETTVRNLLVKLLKGKGYTILEASNGEEALKLITLLGKVQIDLLLTDLVMPKMGGRELAEKVRALRPEQPVLFISGYSRDFSGNEPPPPFDALLLSKPFAPDPLLQAVRASIDGKKPDSSAGQQGSIHSV